MGLRRHLRWPSAALGVLSVFLVTGAGSGPARAATDEVYSFGHEGVIGTSLDLTFVAPSPEIAAAAEGAVLAEIERLRLILSKFDTASEVSHLAAAGRLSSASPELRDVLSQYERWQRETGNAYSPRAGELAALWTRASRDGRAPDVHAVDSVVRAIAQPAWHLDSTTGEIVALTRAVVDLNSLGKGYILDHAMAAARRASPGLRGGLINIGGDIRIWGAPPEGQGRAWHVAVADPRRPAENAPALTYLALTEGSVSSSGGYERGFTIAGEHRSHIVDPRTGYPADHIRGVTVVAPDNATANALATSLSVLSPEEGLRLLAATPGTAGVIVTASGQVLRSPGFAALEVPPLIAAGTAPDATAPSKVHATLAVDLTVGFPYHRRPYVAIWVMDADGKYVRTLEAWGNNQRYSAEFNPYWDAIKQTVPEPAKVLKTVVSLARASRLPGKYTVEWDGLDQKKKPVPPGSYTFWMEVIYEVGGRANAKVTVDCTGPPASGTIKQTNVFAGADVQCSATP